MSRCYWTSWSVTVLTLLLPPISTTILMNVNYNNRPDDIRQIAFTDDLFQGFFDCMCNPGVMRCESGKGFWSSKWNKADKLITPTDSVVLEWAHAYFYTCLINVNEILVCTRTNAVCGSNRTVAFRVENSTCEKCVGLVWQFPSESLHISSRGSVVHGCGITCHCPLNSPTCSVTTPRSAQKRAQIKPSDDKTTFIIAIVVSLIIVIIVCVICIILWKRSRGAWQPDKPERDRKTSVSLCNVSVPSGQSDYKIEFL